MCEQKTNSCKSEKYFTYRQLQSDLLSIKEMLDFIGVTYEEPEELHYIYNIALVYDNGLYIPCKKGELKASFNDYVIKYDKDTFLVLDEVSFNKLFITSSNILSNEEDN